MEIINGLLDALQPSYLISALIGVLAGTLVGVLPGLGPSATIGMLLPVTLLFGDPGASIAMLAGVFYGAMYGGSTTAIVANIPGEVASIPTTYDGFPMAKKGRAGQALWISAVGSFFAGTIGLILLTLVGATLARFALSFTPAAYLALLVFALVAVICLNEGSVIKAIGAAAFGMVLISVGVDEVSGGQLRMTFGIGVLREGLELVPIIVGLFGVTEVLMSAESGIKSFHSGPLGKMMPRGKELKRGFAGILRGTALGFPLGLLPGANPAVASFMAYDLEKRVSRHPERFGRGAIEGVAAPEAANNANAQAGFIPLMSLGIPTTSSLAILMAAFMMFGLQPGPLLFTGDNAGIAWAIIGSMYIGNVMLLVLNLPLVGLWAKISVIPIKYMGPAILAVCIIASYSTRNSMFDVWVTIVFGVIGYLMRKAHWPLSPLILGLIIGPMIEARLAQTLSLPNGLGTLVSTPVPLIILILTIAIIAVSVRLRRVIPTEHREEMLEEAS
ncbi:tripartite tricarboxylate transporter permease [Microbacterium soli]|uniref:Tripartite tricarboxylate transporter permease n=1 Tax=Microbacterium soli TaxID=446075 RepID=A0ABP7NC68_9MICO